MKEFSNSNFKKLEIVEFIDGEKDAFVEFRAYIDDYVMKERSRFLKEDKWYYVNGV
ncbi:MAG: YchJ family metal-binding protein [Nautiliaceae bacterium]